MTRLVRDSIKKLLGEEQQVPELKNEKQASQEKTYKKYTQQDKERLTRPVNEERKSTSAAALELDINPSTFQTWIKKGQDARSQQLYNQSQEPATTATRPTMANRRPTGSALNNSFSETSEPVLQKVYKKYTTQDEDKLLEKGMNTHSAALQLGINPSTAQTWAEKDQDENYACVYRRTQDRTSQYPNSFSSYYTSFGSSKPMNSTPTPEDKKELLSLVRERGMNTHSAARQLGLEPSMAQNWVKKEQDEQDARVYKLKQARAAQYPKNLASSYSTFGSPLTNAELSPEPMNSTKTYKQYTPDDKNKLLSLVRERGMNTRSAALELGINPSTAQTWVKKDQDEQDARRYRQTEKQAAEPSSHYVTGYASGSEDDGELESPIASQRISEQHSPMNATKSYKHYKTQDKDKLFGLIREEGMNTTAAAAQLGINTSTAQSWVKKEKDYAEKTGQASKLLEKQVDHEEPVDGSFPSVNTSDASQLDDRRSGTPQAVPNDVEPTIDAAAKQSRTYKKYTPEDKKALLSLVKEEGMSTHGAASQLGINPSTAQNWVEKDRENPQPVPIQTHHVDQSPVSTDQHAPEKEGYEQSALEQTPEPVKAKRTYKKYTTLDKEKLFGLVKGKGMSIRGAAIELGINPSTAQGWVRKDREADAVLSEEQKEFLTTKIDEQGVLTLDEMLESLRLEFKELDVSKTALCHFAMNRYDICFTLKT
ncbi:hypothetical protein MFLAVUS_005607 [Mucor flavus]|uniref:Transposase n=1 Tax=Mucor flavus TaxID=439312 RepID=A0ABP9YZ64_9FUNG